MRIRIRKRPGKVGVIREHAIQVGVFNWRDNAKPRIPMLALLHAIPNGAGLRHTVKRMRSGKEVRYSPEGVKLKREGMTSGIPDVSWPVPRGAYHGLYIEHKIPSKPKPTATQQEKIDLLRQNGYLVVVSTDALQSIALIQRYWALGEFDWQTHLQPAEAEPNREEQ